MSEPRRIYSVDVFRGITITLMILVNNPGSWGYVYSPLLHAQWHGCTMTDLIFPFFLFLVGVSMRFAFVKWHYFPSQKFHKHLFFRALSIFLAGWFITAYPFIRQDWDWSTFRFMGVLQRIAIAYFISGMLIIRYDFKKLMPVIIGILVFYWGILFFGGSTNPYSLEFNLVRKLDIFLLGEKHLYRGYGIPFDPEGILSTFPTIATVLIGYLIGGMLHTTKNYNDCIKRMTIFGIAIIVIGLIWGIIFPINKALWTSSYVLFTGGIATVLLAILTWIINIQKWKKPFWFFEIFGTNSIFLFIISGLWTKTILAIKLNLNGKSITAYNYLYNTICVPIAGNLNGSLLFAFIHIIGFWLVLYWMYRKKINIKL